MKTFATVLFMLLLLSACGRKGALLPPEALVPAAVQDLHVQQSGGALRVTWSAPSREQGGRPLRDLLEVRLLRRDITGDGSDCSSCADSWRLLATVGPDLPGGAEKSGTTFIYFDKEPPLGSTCQYRLLAVSRSGGVSAPATSPLKKLQPVVSPPSLQAAVTPAAIRLEFGLPTMGKNKLIGFNIYRRANGQESATLPLNAAPVNEKNWEDRQLEFGRTYRYSATAVQELEGEIVESLHSPEVELLFTQQELR